MTLYKTLFKPISDGDDVTTQCVSVLAVVGIIGGVIIILVMLLNILFPARYERAKIAVHNEQQFAQLQKYHGKAALNVVVYEANGKVFYYKDGKKIALK